MPSGSLPQGLFAEEGLSSDVARRLAVTADAAAAFVVLLGATGMAGWAFDIPVLRHLLPALPAVRPMSAVCLALLGASLWWWPRRTALSSALAGMGLAVACLSFAEFFDPAEHLLRRILVHPDLLDSADPEVHERIGLTGPIAAVGYAALALTLLLSRASSLIGLSQGLTITVMFNALVPVLGYFYRLESLISPTTPVAPSLQGAAGITLLAVGILCSTPKRGAMGVLTGRTAGSRTARRLLVPALSLPVLLGGIFLYVRAIGSLDVDAAVPTFVCGLAATLGGSVLWVARADARLEILQRRGEEALRAGADESPLMMWMADAAGACTHMNPAALAFTGFSLKEATGRGWQSFTHPDDLAGVTVEIAVAIQGRRVFSAEFRVRHHDGDWRWVLATGVPRLSAAQELAGFTGSWVDVTPRKDAEQALQRFAVELEHRVEERTAALTESKEVLARQTGLLESIVKSMGDAVLAVSMEGQILLANEAADRLFGASERDAHTNVRVARYGFFLADGVTPFPNEQLPMIRALAGESADNVIMVVRHRGAPEGRFVRVTGRPIRNADGEILGSIVVGRDVTELEEALEATRRLAAVVESSGDAILSVAIDGGISTWNKGAELMYGYGADEILGASLARLVPPPEKRSVESMLTSLLGGAPVIRRDATGRRRDGTVFDITATMTPIHDETGQVHGVSVVHHDISDRKAAERRIQALNDELEERVRERTTALVAANHALENYASSVAHDLRTPLRAIAGFARVLEEDHAAQIDPEGRRLLGVVRTNAQDMGAFIDALLSFSAVDRQPPNKEDLDVETLVRECVESLQGDCEGRSVDFRLGNLPPCRAERASLKQIFLNLLTNAVKFTRRREQAVIEIGSVTDDAGAVVYHVRDNGVGFDMSNTRRLFGIFQRLHAPTEFEGTGLGLANVARIVAAHGGKVWAEAEPEKGATFHFIIEPRGEET
jgi:PAS domain S-box-containing protein